MATLPSFDTPANVNDLQDKPAEEKAMRARWNDNINRFTEQTMQNNPWSSTNQPHLTEFYNPLDVDTPDGSPVVPIQWTAFPRRIRSTFPNVGQRKQWEYADNGPPGNYRPSGPRGWQDEYCEWSVTRNSDNKITKVMFTCENREYWYTLWEIDPEAVLKVYQELVSPAVKLEDLYLLDQNGQPVIDRETGRPGYNDRNQWNSTTTHGAVHLISNPNSLSAEIFLAGQATILREDSNGNPITEKNQLILCSQYGTPNRNSDPTIGAAVNSLVRGHGPGTGVRVSLHNPVGLYIQQPSFGSFQLPFSAPANAKPEDYWKVVRGRVRQGNENLDLILHAVYEVPEDQGFTVSDITIDGFNIDYGAQITDKIQIALAGVGISQVPPPPDSLHCAADPQHPLPRAYVLRDVNMLPSANRSSLNMRIEPNSTVRQVGLYTIDCDRTASIEFTGAPGVSATVTDFQEVGGGQQLFTLTVTAAPDAPVGNRSLLLKNANGAHGPAAFGMIEVVADGTLAPAASTPELAAAAPGTYATTPTVVHHEVNRGSRSK